MGMRVILIAIISALSAACPADEVDALIRNAMAGLTVKSSGTPYSKAIEQVLIGYNDSGIPQVGVAYRNIESFKPITGVVIVHKTESGYVLHEAVFPDIRKIKNAKDRQQVLTVLKQFRNVPFDPHAEKSAVDGLSGATRYGLKTSGYLNYLARHIALKMESNPDWPTVEVP